MILSDITRSSRALREEIDYGINVQGLPVIVIYPKYSEYSDIVDANGIRKQVMKLWEHLPVFKDNMHKVPTIHVPCSKYFIATALGDERYMVNSKTAAGIYFYFTL